MNGNRLFPEPHEWETLEPITKKKLNRVEDAIIAMAEEIIDAAGSENNSAITLKRRLDRMSEQFIPKGDTLFDCGGAQ